MGMCGTSPKMEENPYIKYICKIVLDTKEVSGFLCDIRYSDQKELVPIIITYKDSFPKDFKFKEEEEYIIKRIDYENFNAKLKIIFISDIYNFVIFQISSIITCLKKQKFNNDKETSKYFSFLKINKNIIKKNNSSSYNKDYKFFNLLEPKKNFLDCWIKYIIGENVYIFKYYVKIKNEEVYGKEGIVINQSNTRIGITMGNNSDEGILFDGIINGIQEYLNKKKENDNKIYDNNPNLVGIEKNNYDNDNNKNNSLFIFKAKKQNIINNLNINKDISNLTNNEKSNNKYNHEENKETGGNEKDNSNKSDKSKETLQRKKDNKTKDSTTKENNDVFKETKMNIIAFEENGKESDKKNDEEINLYFLFKNRKELYLDVKESCNFKQVIKQLNEKYLWLKYIEIKEFRFGNNKISEKKSVKDNKLKNNSIIDIIE